MKPFSSPIEFVQHYQAKIKIPSKISIMINGYEHIFKKRFTNNNYQVTKNNSDEYLYAEDDAFGLGIELYVAYVRYFVLKELVEAYFSFIKDDIIFISPIYFYDQFVSDNDFNHCKSGLSDSLEKWTSLKGVNTSILQDAFIDYRSHAYKKAQSDMFYDLLVYLGSIEEEHSPYRTEVYHKERDKKWRINKQEKSPYFKSPVKAPDFW